MQNSIKSPLEVLQDFTQVQFREENDIGIPILEEGLWSRQSVAQNHTLLDEDQTILSFFKNQPDLLEGLKINGPLRLHTREKIKKDIREVYYKNAFYRGDLKDVVKYVKSKSEFDTEIEVPVLEDEEEAVDYIFRYDDYILGLDPFTSTIPKMQFKKIPEDKIAKATSRGQDSRNHLRGKKFGQGYIGYAGLLDLSYYDSSSNKHEEWFTRLKQGTEYTDYSEKKDLQEPIFVVAVFQDKNFYLYGEKEWGGLKWQDVMTAEMFKKLASTVGNSGK